MSHRGHVIAVAYMCALDAVSSYGYKNQNVRKFDRNHFPSTWRPYARLIYPEYRLNLVHAWNLFGKASLLPGDQPVSGENGQVSFGIVTLARAFNTGVDDFLARLETDSHLQERALHRYREVKGEARRAKRNATLSNYRKRRAIPNKVAAPTPSPKPTRPAVKRVCPS